MFGVYCTCVCLPMRACVCVYVGVGAYIQYNAMQTYMLVCTEYL